MNHTFLGLLAKIKCSICSLEFDNSNGGHCPPCYLTHFSGGLPNRSACTAGLAAWPWHCTTALAEHPLYQSNEVHPFLVGALLQSQLMHACIVQGNTNVAVVNLSAGQGGHLAVLLSCEYRRCSLICFVPCMMSCLHASGIREGNGACRC